MAAHQLLAIFKIQTVPIRIPIVLQKLALKLFPNFGPAGFRRPAIAFFEHGIKTHHIPIRHFRIETIMFVVLIPFLQFLHLLLKGFRAGPQFILPLCTRLQVRIRRHIIRQFRDTEVTVYNLQSPRRKTGLQIPMQLSQTGQIFMKQHERQIRFPPHIRIGSDQGMRRVIVRLTQRFQFFAGLRTYLWLQICPQHPVHSVKQVHHMNALFHRYIWQTHRNKKESGASSISPRLAKEKRGWLIH